jgi:hypothetical protein
MTPNKTPEPTATAPCGFDVFFFIMFSLVAKAGSRWPWLSFFR